MRSRDYPVARDIVLLGGGHAHVTVLRRFGMFPINGARITLISPEAHTPYSGMLPGLIAGHYTYDDAHIDLGPLARFAGARFLETSVTGIDPEARLIHCADGRPPVAYDVLSINTGSTPVFDPALALDRDVIPVKPVSTFLEQWEGLKARVLADPGRRIGIVGAGAGGVELLLSMQHALKAAAGTGCWTEAEGPGEFHAFTRDEMVLKTHGGGVRAALEETLSRRGVTVHTGFDVRTVDQAGVADGERAVDVDDIVWVTGAEPPTWFRTSGLAVDARGFMAVDEWLRSTSHADIFGAGDAVTMISDPRPKSGVFAVRQGPVLAHNLRARVLGKPLKKYRPQKWFLSLISTGDQFAIASYGGWSIKGGSVWRWKDRIDRTFMAKFNTLPKMSEKAGAVLPVVADLPDEVAEAVRPDAMRCGGCGAKVGATMLGRMIRSIGAGGMQSAVEGIVLGIGDDAAAIDVPQGALLVQTIDSFPAMISDPFVFGQIAANHALGDIYAMGARPHSVLVTVALPFAAEVKREADLGQVMAGAKKVFDAAGCAIVGGHTGEGAELVLGFAINGFADHGALLRKSGLRPGLGLILTKPIGSGALFAAEGRGQAKGRWVRGAVENALMSSARAGDVLRAHGAVAMTDVTGFGLVGHLGEMLAASGVAASVRLADVPLIDGAVEVVEKGIVSSLQPANFERRGEIDVLPKLAGGAAFQMLFDPQTAGGLLAGVPIEQAEGAVSALRAAGYTRATKIGETRAGNDGGRAIRLV